MKTEQQFMEKVLGSDWLVIERVDSRNEDIHHEPVNGDVSRAYEAKVVWTMCGRGFYPIRPRSTAERPIPEDMFDSIGGYSKFIDEKVIKSTFCIECYLNPAMRS